jgi:hypothetical protein
LSEITRNRKKIGLTTKFRERDASVAG